MTFPVVPREGCPPEVAALARDLAGAVDRMVDAREVGRPGKAVRLAAANEKRLHALRATGWDLHGPTTNVPCGSLSWEVVPISRVATP